MKAAVDKLDTNKLINVPTGLNNLKAKADNLGIAKLEIVPADLKKCDAVSKEVVKNTKFNKLNMKVNSLENKITDATTLIYINQYNTDKQRFEKKLVMLIKNT